MFTFYKMFWFLKEQKIENTQEKQQKRKKQKQRE
jgi:hypothetical protein